MIRRIGSLICTLLLATPFASAQTDVANFPAKVVFARHTFFDFGPPFDFYEIFIVESSGRNLSIARALITPPGDACIQPPTVEVRTGILRSTMWQLFKGKNPCQIPEKAVQEESNRCRNCLKFSGVDVPLHVTCAGKDRQLRMSVLDRDMFDQTPNTPQYTSWTMTVLAKLDRGLGHRLMDRPAFTAIAPNNIDRAPPTSSDVAIAQALRDGKFDDYFHSEPRLSVLVHEAQKPPHPASVTFIEFSPSNPISAELPKYPPIAELAHVTGQVTVLFDVSPAGNTEHITFVSGPKLKMLEGATVAAAAGWRFPQSASGYKERATVDFEMNCGNTRPAGQ